MKGNHSESVKRVAAFSIIAAFLCVSFVGIVNQDCLVGNAAAEGVDVDRQFRLGVVDMTVSTLNPNTYTTAAEMMTIFPCYSSLLQYDVDGEVIGDLAESWTSSPDGLVWEFNIVDNAYFVDPEDPLAAAHPVTAEDIIFTFDSIILEPRSALNPYLNGFIAEMWVENPWHFGLRLTEPYAPLLNALINIPVLPKYYWEGEDLVNFGNSPPIGSGPFYYATLGLPDAGVAQLERNPIWHMIDLHGWSPRVDTWSLVRMPDVTTAYVELRFGNLDMMLNVPAGIYVQDLPNELDLIGISQDSGFVYEFNLNQMTDELRTSLGGAFSSGENSQLLLDPDIKAAFSMCVDKEAFVNDVLYGLGSSADSLVPSASPWHYTYPSPIEYNTEAARELLWDAGWRYDEMGSYYDLLDAAFWDICPLYNSADPTSREALSFRFYTLDTMYEWAQGALMIRSSCAEAGIELDLEIKSVNEMNSVWYAADYDVWLWDWMFDPLGDPSVDILSVMTTSAIGGWSDCFWSNAEYDQLYADSLVEIDVDARGLILDDMQSMLYEDRSCQCVAYRDCLNAMYTGRWASSTDLSSKYMLLPDVSNTWLSIDMYPIDNHAPVIESVSEGVTGEVGEWVSLSASAIDDDISTLLEYRFFWGDGGSSEWSSSAPAASHQYAESGVYAVDVAVREASSSNGFLDYFITSVQAEVVISPSSNLPPYDLSIQHIPVEPNTGNIITFEGFAFDPEGDQLDYSWSFGDGTYAAGQIVNHQYTVGGEYTVTMSVTDNMLGLGTRPVELQTLVLVVENHIPWLTIPDRLITAKTLTEFTVSVMDPDSGDELMLTWDWGDGTVTFTGIPVASHTYDHRGTYILTVIVTDGTGLPGHIVSASALVVVLSPGEGNQHGGARG